MPQVEDLGPRLRRRRQDKIRAMHEKRRAQNAALAKAQDKEARREAGEEISESEVEESSDDEEEEESGAEDEQEELPADDVLMARGKEALDKKDYDLALESLEDMREMSVVCLLRICACYTGLIDYHGDDVEEEDLDDLADYATRIMDGADSKKFAETGFAKPPSNLQVVKAFFYRGKARAQDPDRDKQEMAKRDFEKAMVLDEKESLAPLVKPELFRINKRLGIQERKERKDHFRSEEERMKMERRKISGGKAFNHRAMKH